MKRLGLSITDAQGEMLPFKDVMDELREKFAGLTEEQQAQEAATIFGKQAMAGMLSIINASEEDYKKLTSATRNYSGTAKEMAEIMEDNLQGGLTKLKSALEGVGIQIFELLIPHLQKLVGMLQKAVDWFANLSPATQETLLRWPPWPLPSDRFFLLAVSFLPLKRAFLELQGSYRGDGRNYFR